MSIEQKHKNNNEVFNTLRREEEDMCIYNHNYDLPDQNENSLYKDDE